jgi:hypothetical protein
MKIKDIIQRIRNNFDPAKDVEDKVVLKFLQILEDIRREDMSCDNMYAQLDEFVEREVTARDAARIMPLIQEHIDMCPECCDEYQALMTVLENTRQQS